MRRKQLHTGWIRTGLVLSIIEVTVIAGKLRIQTLLKTCPCVPSCQWWRGWVNTYDDNCYVMRVHPRQYFQL